MTPARAVPYLTVDRPIIDPKTGRPSTFFLQAWNDLVLRTGGQTNDKIAETSVVANVAVSQTVVTNAGVATGFTIDPAYPFIVTPISVDYAQITVTAHTRTESGVTTSLAQAEAPGAVLRGAAYYVYYTTPGAYLATTDASIAADAGVKLIGSVWIEPAQALSFDYSSFGLYT